MQANITVITFILNIIFLSEVTCVKCDLNKLEHYVHDFMELWQYGAKNGPEDFPPIDLLQLPSFDAKYNKGGVRFEFSSGDMEVAGLDKFSIEAINTSCSDGYIVTSQVVIPNIHVQSDNYRLKGRAYLVVPLSGSGKLSLDINNTIMETTMVIDSSQAAVKSVVLNFTIDNANVQLQDSSWAIKSGASGRFMELVRSHHDEIAPVIADEIKFYFEKYLHIQPLALSEDMIVAQECNDIENSMICNED